MNRSFAVVFASLLAMSASTLALAGGTAPAAPQAQTAPAATAPAAKQTASARKGVHKAGKVRRTSKSRKASTPPAARRK